MQTLDAVLTYSAIAVLFGSMLYFPAMFVVFVLKSESEKAQAIKIASVVSQVEELQVTVDQVRERIEAVEAKQEQKLSATDVDATQNDTTEIVNTGKETSFVEKDLHNEESNIPVLPTQTR